MVDQHFIPSASIIDDTIANLRILGDVDAVRLQLKFNQIMIEFDQIVVGIQSNYGQNSIEL